MPSEPAGSEAEAQARSRDEDDRRADAGSRAALARALDDLALERAAFGQDLGDPRGRIARLWRKVVRRLLRWYATPQTAWNDDASRAMRELAALTQRQAARIDELAARLDAAGTPPAPPLNPGALARLGPPSPPPLVAELAVELTRVGPVLVLGAAHGWRIAELRRVNAEVSVVGVEAVGAWADEARAAGMEVEHGPPLAMLARFPAESHGAVAIDRLVEETPLEGLLELLRAARNALVPGGLVVATAINPAHRLAPALLAARVGPARLVTPPLLAALGAAAGLVDAGAYPLGSSTTGERILAPRYALPDDAPHYAFVWRALG